MPAGAVKVDRTTRWGNPWYVGEGRVRLLTGELVNIGCTITAAGVVDRFRRWHRGEFGSKIGPHDHPIYGLVMAPGAAPDITQLRGKDLACWCPIGAPCHADVLIELANR